MSVAVFRIIVRWKKTQIAFNRYMDKQHVAYLYNDIFPKQ